MVLFNYRLHFSLHRNHTCSVALPPVTTCEYHPYPTPTPRPDQHPPPPGPGPPPPFFFKFPPEIYQNHFFTTLPA